MGYGAQFLKIQLIKQRLVESSAELMFALSPPSLLYDHLPWTANTRPTSKEERHNQTLIKHLRLQKLLKVRYNDENCGRWNSQTDIRHRGL